MNQIKVNIISFFTLVVFGFSCEGAYQNDQISKNETKSRTEYCLEKNLSDYYNTYEEMKSELIDFGLVDDSKESYANLYLNIDSIEYGIYERDIYKMNTFSHIDGLGPHFPIHICSCFASEDTLLSDNQKDYYLHYDRSGKTGRFSPDTIAMLIMKMSDEEFTTDGVKASTVFYLGHKFVFNRYFVVREENVH